MQANRSQFISRIYTFLLLKRRLEPHPSKTSTLGIPSHEYKGETIQKEACPGLYNGEDESRVKQEVGLNWYV